jgi:hypothetical protein
MTPRARGNDACFTLHAEAERAQRRGDYALAETLFREAATHSYSDEGEAVLIAKAEAARRLRTSPLRTV